MPAGGPCSPCCRVHLFCSVLFCGEAVGRVTAQGGVWQPASDHKASGTEVQLDPLLSQSGGLSQSWITENPATQGGAPVTPGQRFQAIHACLVPSGVHRGEVLVWDGNLTNYGARTHQPWAIVNPYWPAPNPYVPNGLFVRFYNGRPGPVRFRRWRPSVTTATS